MAYVPTWRRPRVPRAGVADRQVLPVDQRVDRGRQVRRQGRRRAVGLLVVADRVAEGVLVHRQRAVGQGHRVVARQTRAVGHHAGDGVRAHVGRPRVPRAGVADRQVLPVDQRVDRGRQVRRQGRRRAVGLLVVADRVAEGVLVHRQRAVGQGHRVVARQTRAVGHHAGDGVRAHVGRPRVPRAGVADRQVLPVDQRVDRGRQVRRQGRRRAVGLLVVADRVAEGVLVHRQRAVGQGHRVVARQTRAVGHHAGDGVRAHVGRPRVPRAGVADRQVLPVDQRVDRGRQVRRQGRRRAVGLLVVADRVAEGVLVHRQRAVGQGHRVVARQTRAVGHHAGDGVRAHVGRPRVPRAGVADRQVLPVDQRVDRGRQVRRQGRRRAVGLLVVADRVAEGVLVHRQRAVGQGHRVVARQTRAVGHHAGDGVRAHVGRPRVPRAGVADRQVLPVDQRVDRGRQVRRQGRRRAVGLLVVADRVAEGVLVHRQRAVGQGHRVVARQTRAVGHHAGDGVRAHVGRPRVPRAGVADRQVLPVDQRVDRGRQVRRQGRRRAVGLLVVADRVAEGVLVHRQRAVGQGHRVVARQTRAVGHHAGDGVRAHVGRPRVPRAGVADRQVLPVDQRVDRGRQVRRQGRRRAVGLLVVADRVAEGVLVHRQRAVGQGHRVVARQTRAVGHHAGDGVRAHVGRPRVPRAGVADRQVLPVDQRVDRGRQVRRQGRRRAVGLLVVADRVAEGVLVHRQRARAIDGGKRVQARRLVGIGDAVSPMRNVERAGIENE